MSWLTRITAPEYIGQRLDQRLAAFDVEVVGRLVQDQQMRRVDGGQQAATAAPSARPTAAPTTVSAWSACRPKPASRARAALALGGAQAQDMLQRRLVDVQLVHLMLGEIADPQPRRDHHLARH
jgi:hypothetical protein